MHFLDDRQIYILYNNYNYYIIYNTIITIFCRFSFYILSFCRLSFCRLSFDKIQDNHFFLKSFGSFANIAYLCSVKTKNLYINILESIWHALALPMHNLLTISILPPPQQGGSIGVTSLHVYGVSVPCHYWLRPLVAGNFFVYPLDFIS